MYVKTNNYKKVGKVEKWGFLKYGFKYYGYVYISNKIFTHIKRRHGRQLTKNIKSKLSVIIERIIKCPDYIEVISGDGESIKLIKTIDANIALILAYDKEKEYIYVKTLYPLTKKKVKSRINYGKLKVANSL